MSEAAREAMARVLYETEEKLRADDDIPDSPWVPWSHQTSSRERRIFLAMADAALAQHAERERALREALRLPLLFHSGGPWDDSRRLEWCRITGTDEATTKVMCDTIRK